VKLKSGKRRRTCALPYVVIRFLGILTSPRVAIVAVLYACASRQKSQDDFTVRIWMEVFEEILQHPQKSLCHDSLRRIEGVMGWVAVAR